MGNYQIMADVIAVKIASVTPQNWPSSTNISKILSPMVGSKRANRERLLESEQRHLNQTDVNEIQMGRLNGAGFGVELRPLNQHWLDAVLPGLK